MTFSLKTFLIVIGWCAILVGSVTATTQLPLDRVELPLAVVSILVAGFLVFACIGSLNDRAETRPFWAGCAITCVVLLIFTFLPIIADRDQPISTIAARWIVDSSEHIKPVMGKWYVQRVSMLVTLWSIPVLSYVGGMCAVWFRHRQTTANRD